LQNYLRTYLELKPMPAPLVLYHANCWDGFCAAWIVKNARGFVDARPVHYGSQPPDVTNRDVYILDFSYPVDVMKDLITQARSLVWIDHHSSAQPVRDMLAQERGAVWWMFDTTRSAAMLTWSLLGLQKRNWLVEYTE